ncbi:hypothetical protein [Hwanghaeella sp. 1Z406]|uniref:hypothetical protein n=1 Tax=Hwanghaeella sp. 1Z406 TaxID=3402811 RepID=UPI003B67216B
MMIQSTDIIAGVAIVTSVITFLWGFKKSKILNSQTEWYRIWASDFLQQANSFNRLANEITVGISLWNNLNNEGKSDDAEKKLEEITRSITEISFYEWELRKYSQFAPRNADKFCQCADKLFKSLSELINYCKNPKREGSFNLEEIRTAQFLYSKASRDLHKELLGL